MQQVCNIQPSLRAEQQFACVFQFPFSFSPVNEKQSLWDYDVLEKEHGYAVNWKALMGIYSHIPILIARGVLIDLCLFLVNDFLYPVYPLLQLFFCLGRQFKKLAVSTPNSERPLLMTFSLWAKFWKTVIHESTIISSTELYLLELY